MELWNDYGITSYNMAVTGSRIPTTYWILKNALQYTTPKIVVMEATYFYNEKYSPSNVNRFFDSIPLSRLKLEAAQDLFGGDTLSILKSLFPFTIYHSRVKSLTKQDFKQESSGLFGNIPKYSLSVREFSNSEPEKASPIPDLCMEYIQKIIDLCSESEIEIVFYQTPFFDFSNKNKEKLLSFKNFMISNGYQFISSDDVYNEIDLTTDYNDHDLSNSHMNISGALKTTHVVGEYIEKHFQLPDHRNDERFSEWQEQYNTYYQYKCDKFDSIASMEEFLLKCSDDDFMYSIEMYYPELWISEVDYDLFRNIGIEENLIKPGTNSVFIIDNKEVAGVRYDFLDDMDYSFQTSIGKISFLSLEDGKIYRMLWNDEIIYDALYSNTKITDVRVNVIDKKTHRVVSNLLWWYEGSIPKGLHKRE